MNRCKRCSEGLSTNFCPDCGAQADPGAIGSLLDYLTGQSDRSKKRLYDSREKLSKNEPGTPLHEAWSRNVSRCERNVDKWEGWRSKLEAMIEARK